MNPVLPYYLLGVSLTLASCFRGPGFMKQTGSSSLFQGSNVVTITTSETDGVVSASLSANSNMTQAMTVSTSSAISGSSVAFPPGALALDTKIAIQEAAALSSGTTVTQLGITSGVKSSGAAVMVKSSVAMDASKPFTLAIPLPASSGFFFSQDLTNLVVLYKVEMVALGKTVIGVIPKSELKIEGDTVAFATKYFGAFQAVVTEKPVEKVAEVTSTEPILTKKEEYSTDKATETATTPTSTSSAVTVPPTFSYGLSNYTLLTGSAINPIYANNTGGPIESCATSVPMPSGLTLGSDCTIAGTPTTAQNPVAYAITASNAIGSSAPIVIYIGINHPMPTFGGVSPAMGSILGGTAVTITGANFQAGATVHLGGYPCTSVNVTSTQITCTTPAQGEGFVEIVIQNPDGQYVTIPSAYSYQNNPAGLMFMAMPPSNGVINQPMPNFSVRVVREDGSTDTSWSAPASISVYQWSGCTSGGEGPGTLTLSGGTSGIMPSGGSWNFSGATYTKKHPVHFKITSGQFSICSSSPVEMTIGACNMSFGGSIIESEGHQNLDFIATCRRPTANTNDIPFSSAVTNLCAVGWHACYPSEYSDIQRANYGINDISTNSNTTFLNTEGTLNDGTTPYYFENNAAGACQPVSGSDRIMAGAQYWSGWTVYKDGSTCATDGTHGEISSVVNTASWRPLGYRFMFTSPTSSGDGAVCCRNTNPQFSCSAKSTQPTCLMYSSCTWNSGTSTCNSL